MMETKSISETLVYNAALILLIARQESTMIWHLNGGLAETEETVVARQRPVNTSRNRGTVGIHVYALSLPRLYTSNKDERHYSNIHCWEPLHRNDQ
jgi:hypothetical protein